MKKHMTNALALGLALIMIFSIVPVVAVEVGDGAAFLTALPQDGSYGVIYNVDGFVMGADLSDGVAPAKTAAISTDETRIPSLPNGTAVVRFIKTGDDYYFTVGGKYLTVKDLAQGGTQKLVLTDSVESGSKWTFVPDQAGRAGCWNIKNAEYQYNGKDVYLEQYQSRQFSTYTYKSSTASLYQMRIAATEADEDGRVGELVQAGPRPVSGGKYVIYNHAAKAVFGQPNWMGEEMRGLLASPAQLDAARSLPYENVSDGGLIFNVTATEADGTTFYTFENNGLFLAMPENTTDANGKIINEEYIYLAPSPEPDKRGYIQWTLEEIGGGYVLYNAAAKYYSSKCCIEFFDELFSGWTYKAANAEIYAMNFFPMEDRDGCGYVSNPSVEFDPATPSVGTDCVVGFTLNDAAEVQSVTAAFSCARTGENGEPVSGAPWLSEVTCTGKKGSLTVPTERLAGFEQLTVSVTATDSLGKTYEGTCTLEIQDVPLILDVTPASASATGEEKQPEIAVRFANAGEWVEIELPDTVDPVARFIDVQPGKWYTDAVDYVVERGMMSGQREDFFGVQNKLTREQFIMILWRLAGSPEHSCDNPFADVSEENYAFPAILWAYENGITAGKTPTSFGRKLEVSRQELACFFLRYAELRGLDTRPRADLSVFPDAGSMSAYAREPLEWAVAMGLFSGSNGNLNPKQSATRGQIAVIMRAFDRLFGPNMMQSIESLEGIVFEMLLDGQPVAATLTDNTVRYLPDAPLADGKHTVCVTITRTDGKQVRKEWFFYVGQGGDALYFGQIHSHTAEYSDGSGTLEDAYEHAHGVDNLDFLIVTDHSNYFDTTSTATTSSYYDLNSLLKTQDGALTKWEEARATAKTYNERYDDMVCMYGYEMTWSGGPGHTNSFNTYGVISRNNTALNDKAAYAGMHLYNDLMVNAEKGLSIEGEAAKTVRDGREITGVNATKYIPFDENGEPVPVVSQFNHPGKTFGNFDNFSGYNVKRDDVLNLIEVGNGEGKVGGSAYFPSYEEYDRCLSMGWHVAPTNNQDNHKGNWGDSNTCRDVVLTDDFSEIGIYRALDARRVYATEDQNLEVYYELAISGETYKLGDIAPIPDDEQPASVTVRFTLNDPDGEEIATLAVIGEGGRTLNQLDVNAAYCSSELTLDNSSAFYYLRVVQQDGDIAVTAPVWVKEAVPVSVDLSTSASVAAQGEEETVTAKLTNGSEAEALTLTGYRIEAEGRVLDEKAGLTQTVSANSELTLTVPFTPAPTDPPAKKTYEVTVSFAVVFKGRSLTCSKTITETSYPPELMTYIGLDRGHKNFYVSGDYAENDTSFLQICAERGIICQYIDEGQMTKENLAKYKAVILTVPRINDKTQPPVWTEDELEALADYAAHGGNLVNLSKSDRYDYAELDANGQDTYRYASATLSNTVNEAVGAKARFVRGIVVDNERMANEAYRINFSGRSLLGEHLFTQGIYPTSNGTYQWYNGTGIVGGEGVVSLVAPYASSWVASYRDNFTGSSYVPDYEHDTVMAEKGAFSLVTCETLPGGGFLVCAGACFISNYDLKFGTAARDQYENYGLVCNLLDFIKDGAFDGEITPIADVHNGAEGQEFTIEGIVTSNASDYDKNTAFFDCIYVQDETRGINIFPVSGYFCVGERVRVHGAVTYYCGEIELNLSPEYNGSIRVISNDVTPCEPKAVTCAEAMQDENIGNLMRVTGVITALHKTSDVIDRIYVDDGSGEQAMFYINPYIRKDSAALNEAAVGMMIEGVGIGSRDVDEEDGGTAVRAPEQYLKRLRVRDRDEFTVWKQELDTAALEQAIAAAQAIDRTLYTDASLEVLDQALAAAIAVLNKTDKTQREVTEAANALNAAIAGLELLPQQAGFGNRTALVQGDKVVIYHPASGKALSSKVSGKTLEGAAVEVSHGELVSAEGAAICTVAYPEGDDVNFYLKLADGTYLTSGPTGNELKLEATPNEYSLWYLQVKDADAGTVFVRSTNAVYGSGESAKPQALEYYNNAFTTYGWSDKAAFIFQLYVELS